MHYEKTTPDIRFASLPNAAQNVTKRVGGINTFFAAIALFYQFSCCSIFAQESRRVTTRLNTGRSAVELSGSKQKYPSRSNW